MPATRRKTSSNRSSLNVSEGKPIPDLEDVENPLTLFDDGSLVCYARALARHVDLFEPEEELFIRAARIAQRPEGWRSVTGLTNEEIKALSFEKTTSIFEQSRRMKVSILAVCCSIFSQGWYQSSRNQLSGFESSMSVSSQLTMRIFNEAGAILCDLIAINGPDMFHSLVDSRRDAIFMASIFQSVVEITALLFTRWNSMIWCRLLLGISSGMNAAVTSILGSELKTAHLRNSKLSYTFLDFVCATAGFACNTSVFFFMPSGQSHIVFLTLAMVLQLGWTISESCQWLVQEGAISHAYKNFYNLAPTKLQAAINLIYVHCRTVLRKEKLLVSHPSLGTFMVDVLVACIQILEFWPKGIYSRTLLTILFLNICGFILIRLQHVEHEVFFQIVLSAGVALVLVFLMRSTFLLYLLISLTREAFSSNVLQIVLEFTICSRYFFLLSTNFDYLDVQSREDADSESSFSVRSDESPASHAKQPVSNPTVNWRSGQMIAATKPPPVTAMVSWKCHCGTLVKDRYTETSPGGIVKVDEEIQKSLTTALPTVNSTPFDNPPVVTPVADENLQTNSKSKNSKFSITQRSVQYLLLCLPATSGFRLHQQQLLSPENDRELFELLRKVCSSNRLSFRTVTSISLTGFLADLAHYVDVRAHQMYCGTKCDCIPPTHLLVPSSTAEYHCDPQRPPVMPPIGTNYLTHCFQSPKCVSTQSKWVLNQVPKRVVGQLAVTSAVEANQGWGLVLEEGWDRKKIRMVLLLLFGLGSCLFGVLWAVFKKDLQGAFAVASYWIASLAVVGGFIGTYER